MKKELLIALVQSFVDAALQEHITENPPVKGPRGLRGKAGLDFDIDLHRDTIVSELRTLVDNSLPSLKLRFEDLSDEDIASLRGSRGRDGKDGRDGHDGESGKDFSLEENKDIISELIYSMVDEASEKHKLTYNDLSDDDKLQLRGPRGQKGKQGKPFIFEDYAAEIKTILYDNRLKFTDLSHEEIDQIKLKFSHLSDEDKSELSLTYDKLDENQIAELRGPRGFKGQKGKDGDQGLQGVAGIDGTQGPQGATGEQGPKGSRGLRGEKGVQGETGSAGDQGPQGEQGFRGQRGQRGEKGFQGETGEQGIAGEQGPKGPRGQKGPRGVDGVKGDIGERGAVGPMGPMGIIGPTGSQGPQGTIGLEGPKGEDAPYIVDITPYQLNEKFYLRFEFSDGRFIDTKDIFMPKAKQSVIQCITGGGGDSGGGISEIVLEWNGAEIGSSDTINFTGDSVEVIDSGDGKMEVAINQTPIVVSDEGTEISSNVKHFNFVGDGVIVKAQTTVGDWVILSDVPTMDADLIDPTTVQVEITRNETVESANFLTVKRILDEDCTINQLVSTTSGTNVNIADSGILGRERVLGMALHAGVAGDEISILLFGNVLGSFHFGLNKPLYLSNNGSMTETPPTTGFITKVASSNGNGSIFMQPEEPLEIIV